MECNQVVADVASARVLLEAGDLAGAEDMLRKSLAAHGKNSKSFELLAYVLQQQNRLAEARDAARSALSLEPSSWLANFVEGMCCESMGLLPEAQTAFDAAAKIAPKDVQTVEHRLSVAMLMEGVEATRKLYTQLPIVMREQIPESELEKILNRGDLKSKPLVQIKAAGSPAVRSNPPRLGGGSISNSFIRRGLEDLYRGLASWRVWHLIGIGNIRRRYARSRIGQFWTTLSMGIMITVLGLVWSTLWKQDLHEIFPYIASSLVLWTFLTGTINDATTAIVGSSHYFLNQGMSFSTPIYAAIYSQFIILLHNMIIVLLVLVIFPPSFTFETFLFIPGFMLTLVTLVWVSCVVGILCARYRDVIQLVSSVLTTAFYVTPVIFKPEYIPINYRWINFVNPFAIFLSIMRDPLFGREIPWEYWAIAAAIAVFGTIFTLQLVGRYSKRVIFWI